VVDIICISDARSGKYQIYTCILISCLTVTDLVFPKQKNQIQAFPAHTYDTTATAVLSDTEKFYISFKT